MNWTLLQQQSEASHHSVLGKEEKMEKAPLSLFVLTYNSEEDIELCLASVTGWADEIFVVDSFSTDRTVDVARDNDVRVYFHEFESFAKQRNWALENLPFKNEWILHLDADERLTSELREEIAQLLISSANVLDGYYIKRRFIWMGRWLRHGGQYPSAELRLFRRHLVRVIDAGHREYVALRGRVGTLRNDMIHESAKGLFWWIEKHNMYSVREAEELFRCSGVKSLSDVASEEVLEGNKRVWLRKNIWARMPPVVRAFVMFAYRYVFQLGFLDGIPGFLYCFFHDLWYQLLIDAKLLEASRKQKRYLDSSNTHNTP